MGVHLFDDSLMGVKVEPPNQLLPKHGLALPWWSAFSAPCPAALGRGHSLGGGHSLRGRWVLRGCACALVFLSPGAPADSLAQTRAV